MQSPPSTNSTGFYDGRAADVLQIRFIPVYCALLVVCWCSCAKSWMRLPPGAQWIAHAFRILHIMNAVGLLGAALFYGRHSEITLLGRLYPFWGLQTALFSTASLCTLSQGVLVYILYSQAFNYDVWFAGVMYTPIAGIYIYILGIIFVYPTFFNPALGKVLAVTLAGDATAMSVDLVLLLTIRYASRVEDERATSIQRLESVALRAWFVRTVQMLLPGILVLFGADHYGILCSTVSFYSYGLVNSFYPLVVWQAYCLLASENNVVYEVAGEKAGKEDGKLPG